MRANIKIYFSLFRIRFNQNLQYRAVVLGAVAKGFFWALLEVLGYLALYRRAGAFPMELSQTITYVWAFQAFIVLFTVVFGDGEIYSAIRSGAVAYDLVRPVDLYGRWFCQSASNRLSFALVNCFPVLLMGALLPKPYGLTLPGSLWQLILFAVSALLAFGVTVALSMLMYISLFYLISQRGIQMMVRLTTIFLSGGIVPLPFFRNRYFGSCDGFPLPPCRTCPCRFSAVISRERMRLEGSSFRSSGCPRWCWREEPQWGRLREK